MSDNDKLHLLVIYSMVMISALITWLLYQEWARPTPRKLQINKMESRP